MGSIMQNLEKCNWWTFAQAKKYPPALYSDIVILDGIGQAAASSLNSVFIVQFYRKCKKADTHMGICLFGTLEGTRTPDLLIRSQSLYPTELPAHTALSQAPAYNSIEKMKMQVLF